MSSTAPPVELEEVTESDLPVDDLKWLNEGVERLGVSIESVLSPDKDLHYSPSRLGRRRYGAIPCKDDYLEYNVTLYDIRNEDSEGTVSWLYSLTQGEAFEPARYIVMKDFLCVMVDIITHLTKLGKTKCSFDKTWIKQVRKRIIFVQDMYFCDNEQHMKIVMTWGRLLEICKTKDEEFLEISRQNIFAGKVAKKRQIAKPEPGWEDLPPSEGKEWVEKAEQSIHST